jgi:glutamate-1-semialdehyde 2,1-aminomutase
MNVMDRKRSSELYSASCEVIPAGVNSPVRCFPDLSLTPLIVASGQGSRLWDVDGHSYIDYCGSWGALILGHSHPRVVQAAQEQISKGSSFGIATESEEKLARKIVQHIPGVEKIRFVSSGTEAAMSALRLARGFTGKPGIIKFDGNYHGHSDSLLVRAGSGLTDMNRESSSKGVPAGIVQHTYSLAFNDIEGFSSFLAAHDEIAAVILEPVAGNMGVVPATEAFIRHVRQKTAERDILLIFDEVISGFRLGLQGASGIYQTVPDLFCFGKIIAGGFPAAAFGGRREIMDLLAPLGEVYQAGTLSGNPVAMRAGLETLLELETPHFYEELQKKADFLLKPIEKAIAPLGSVQRRGSMFTLFFGAQEVKNRDDLKKCNFPLFKQFFHFLFERGIYMPPSPYESSFISSAHTYDDLEKTQNIILEFLRQAHE